MPCYVLIPRNVVPPYRAVIALHGHGTDGTRLLLGLARNEKERALMRADNWDYARQLARHGFIVFAPVQRALGERLEANRAYRTQLGRRAKSCTLTTLTSFMLGRTMAGLRVWDVMRTIDYIRTRPEPIADKIGCIGWSGGGTTTFYAAALDERISAVVLESCVLHISRVHLVHRTLRRQLHPGDFALCGDGGYWGSIAPRPVLIESGMQDPIFPIKGVKQAYGELARVYALLNRRDQLAANYFRGGHRIGGRQAFVWFERWLAESTR